MPLKTKIVPIALHAAARARHSQREFVYAVSLGAGFHKRAAIALHEVRRAEGESQKILKGASGGTNLVLVALPAGREHATFSENLCTRFRSRSAFISKLQ